MFCSICRSHKISCAQKNDEHVIIFWNIKSNGRNNYVILCVVDWQLNHCTWCVFLRRCNADEISMQPGSLRGLTALQEHSALTDSCDVWLIIGVLTGFVISGLCDRSSRKWRCWKIRKPAAPPQSYKCFTFKCTIVQRFDYTPQKFSLSGVEIPSWIGRIACCHGTMLIKTMALSIADDTSHQIAFSNFRNTTVI